jgi:hypothetical protein
MGWSVGYDENWKRDIGYGVPAVCDHPGCNERIDRGLTYACGGEPYGGDEGCGLFFCDAHLLIEHGTRESRFVCERCCEGEEPFAPKPDIPEWVLHKLTHPSWSKARDGLVAPACGAELAARALDWIRWVQVSERVVDDDREAVRALDAWLRGEL